MQTATKLVRLVAITLGLSLAVTGCGGDSSDGTGGPHIDTSDCKLDASFSGGYSGGLDVNGCGSGGDTVLSFLEQEFPGAEAVTLRLEFVDALAAEATGSPELDFVALQVSDGEDAERQWQTPSGACSVDVTSNVFAPVHYFEHRYLISGSVECTAPAEPVGPAEAGGGDAVELGSFTFTGFMSFPDGPHATGDAQTDA